MIAYHRIPSELCALNQWVMWQYVTVAGLEKPTKVPYSGITNQLASVIDASSWCPFDQAVSAVSKFAGIGLVLTDIDPYCFCDLDQTNNADWVKVQEQIFQKLDSYSELSPSGKGLHIITRGSIPHGRKQHAVELYSTRRFMTMTGDVFLDKPIAQRQDILDILYNQMSRGKDGRFHEFESQPETNTDEQVLNEGAAASHNGGKFRELWHGKWDTHYQSQSEADFAFIDMVANYTDSKIQVERIFLNSWLGNREKAKRRDYVRNMVHRAFDRRLTPVSFNVNPIYKLNGATQQGGGTGGGSNVAEVAPNFQPITDAVQNPVKSGPSNQTLAAPVVNFPNGLIGDCAQFILGQAFHPNAEMSLMAGILLIAGIAGRQFNVDGAGLNLYGVLIAETTMGKEAMASGMGKLLFALKRTVPGIGDFIGPDEIASGPALLKHLEKQPCCVTVFAEFGLLLNSMYGDHVPPYLMTLRRTLLNVYAKSGRHNILGKTIYSDKDKAINEIHEPAFSILGESTPSTFYKNLDDSLVAEGLVARLFIVEVRSPRQELNRQRLTVPDQNLVFRLGEFAAYCIGHRTTDTVMDVRWSLEARQLEMAFSTNVNNILNDRQNELNSSLRDLWGRAPLTIMKLSALFAISENYLNPIIAPSHWLLAQELVERAVMNIINRFKTGDVGTAKPEDSQLARMKVEVKRLWANPVPLESYGLTVELLKNRVVPYLWFARKLQHAKEFKPPTNTRTTFKDHGTEAIKRCLQTLCDEGVLRKLTEGERGKYNTSAVLYEVRTEPD